MPEQVSSQYEGGALRKEATLRGTGTRGSSRPQPNQEGQAGQRIAVGQAVTPSADPTKRSMVASRQQQQACV